MNNNFQPSDVTRRDFIKGGSLATLFGMLGAVELTARAEEGTNISSAPTGPNLKCGVIGLGAWGRELVGLLTQVPGVEVAGLCDTYPVFLRRGSRLAPDAQAVEDSRALLENSEIKAVLVTTPSHLHKQLVLDALEAGKHVYCEAPLAATVEDARAIALAAKSRYPKQYFQAGLQNRADVQRHFLLPFVRAGAHGRNVQARAQWHRKESWRRTSPSAERERDLNWRLTSKTSPGLIGELGIHQIDGISWYYNQRPISVTAFGAIINNRDGRDVPDTVQAIFEYADGVRLIYDATLGNSFDGEYEMLYGTNAAIMLRESKAWMFKESDAPLLGWEVYARKDSFHKEVGIALSANASKISAQAETATSEVAVTESPIFHALQTFVTNSRELSSGVENYVDLFGTADDDSVKEYLATVPLQPAAGYREGYEATVVALKANEAAVKNGRIDFDPAWFDLS